MKNYELIEKMNREVYKVSNSRKVLKKTKKYLEANGYNTWWNPETEVLEVCPAGKSVMADRDYTAIITYRSDYGYKISAAYYGSYFMDSYSCVVMVDMMKLANRIMEIIEANIHKLESLSH